MNNRASKQSYNTQQIPLSSYRGITGRVKGSKVFLVGFEIQLPLKIGIWRSGIELLKHG